MKHCVKILSLILAFVLLLCSILLTSCKKPTIEETVESGTYIIKTEIKDGCIWVTYSNDPENPVNIGAMGVDGNTSSDASLNYLPLPDGTYGVTAGNAKYLEEIVIPETYNGKTVTTIIESGFSGASNLKKLTVPDTITTVGDNAFDNCDNLAFNEYENGKYLGNASNPYVVLVEAKDTSITQCTVNEKANAICNNAFYNCSDLKTLTIPNGITSIGSRAFYNCKALSEINFPDGNGFIGVETFYGCSSLKKIAIPASVIAIDTSAFMGCSALEEVTFANNSSLVGISNAAFSGCTNLKSITIPKKVTFIGDSKASDSKNGVFYNCDALTTVTFEDGSALTDIGNFAFDSCDKLKNIVLPASLKKLGHSSFRNCGITKIVIPEGISSIKARTFLNCKSLTSITIGAAVTKIEAEAFASCKLLNNITIPANVVVIGTSAFFECSALNNVTVAAPAGWHAAGKTDTTNIAEADMSNPETAATHLTTTYFDCMIAK